MHKTKMLATVAAAGLMSAAAPAWAATTIDLSATNFAQSAVTQNFAAGSYVVSYTVNGLYKAWAPATPATSADGTTGNWEDRYGITLNGASTQFSPYNGQRFATADAAFNAFKTLTYSFSLLQAANVTFFIPDSAGSFGDNAGGVSLNVSAVPEPATWAMMVLGFFGIASVLRSKRARKTALAA